MAPLYTASQVNLLIYHYLKESGFHHACFALRHESRLDEEPLSHEAVILPGRLLEVLEKGILYMTVENHLDEDGNERRCAHPASLIGPDAHVCDDSANDQTATEEVKKSAEASRLTPSPPPEPVVRFVETSVQTSVPPERRSASRASSVTPQDDSIKKSGATDDRSSKVASTSKSTLDAVPEEAEDKKRKAEVSKATKGEKRAKRDGTPKTNGRSAAPSEEVDEERTRASGERGVRDEHASSSSTPAKKNKRGANSTKSSAAGSGNGTNGTSTKAEKANGSNAYLPPLIGKAKGKQISSAKIARLKGHSAEVFVSAWNPAVPGLLASGAGDATVRIWDLGPALNSTEALADAEPITPTVCKHLPSTHAKDVSALSWNPDGTLLASGSYDGILRLWTPQGDLHLVMSMHQGPIFAVRWNRRGNFVLTSSADGTAIVWDLNSGKVRQQFSSHSDSVLDIDWLTGSMEANPTKENAPTAAADSILATCSADNSINMLRLGEPKPIKTLKGHTDEVNAIRFDPTGTLLASVSDDATARIWSVETILGPGIVTSASNGITGTTSDAQSVKRNSHSVTPRPSGGRGESADRMDVDDAGSSAGDLSAGGVANDLLYGGGPSSSIGGSGSYCRFVLTGHKKDIFATAWAPHQHGSVEPRLLATASFDNTARIWNAEDGTCLRVFEEHTDSVYSVCFSPDRRFLVTGGMDHRLFVSAIDSGEILLAHATGGGVFDVQWNSSKPRKSIEGASHDGKPTTKVKAEDSLSEDAASASNVGTLVDGADPIASTSTAATSAIGGKHHFLALSQRDKTLTILDVSGL